MNAGESATEPTGSSNRRRIQIAAAVVAVIAVAIGGGLWIYRDQHPEMIEGRVLSAGDPRTEAGGVCMVHTEGYRLDEGARVSLWAMTATGDLGESVTTTLGRGRFVAVDGGMACAFPFSLPRPKEGADRYRLTATSRKDATDVRTHYWDVSPDIIFGGEPIDVDL